VPQFILPKDVDSKFRFITVAAQRAKQIQAGAKPRVDPRSRKATGIAMEEVLAGAISWELIDIEELAAERAAGEEAAEA